MDKKFKIIVSVALALLGIVAMVMTFVLVTLLMNKDGQGVEKEQTTVETIAAKELEIVTLADAITANILDEKGNTHIVRISLAFQLHKKDSAYKTVSETLANNPIVIKDEVISVIREQTYEMMLKVDAKEKVKDELLGRLNKKLDTGAFKDIFFGDFFVQ